MHASAQASSDSPIQDELTPSSFPTMASSTPSRLIVRIYVDDDGPSSPPPSSRSRLADIAHVCGIINDAVREMIGEAKFGLRGGYRWDAGGDGMVFGVHAEGEVRQGGEKCACVPHLRSDIAYGSDADDEWFATFIVHALSCPRSSSLPLETRRRLSFHLIDEPDGPYLLIESAKVLPDWVERSEESSHRHRTWIRDGRVVLLPPEVLDHVNGEQDHETRDRAARLLRLLFRPTAGRRPSPRVFRALCPDGISSAVLSRAAETMQRSSDCGKGTRARRMHRVAALLPTVVARILRRRPDLINACVRVYEESRLEFARGRRFCPKDDSGVVFPYADLVVDTLEITQRAYASLVGEVADTVVGVSPYPLSAETRRMRRRCSKATHLKYAPSIGERITFGLEMLLQNDRQRNDVDTAVAGHVERRIGTYIALDMLCGGDGRWIGEAYSAGPSSSSSVAITSLVSNLTYSETLVGLCPLTFPDMSLWDQISSALKEDVENFHDHFPVPIDLDVDSDEWMNEMMEKSDDSAELFEDVFLGEQDEEESPIWTIEGSVLNEIEALLGRGGGPARYIPVNPASPLLPINDGGVSINVDSFLDILRGEQDEELSWNANEDTGNKDSNYSENENPVRDDINIMDPKTTVDDVPLSSASTQKETPVIRTFANLDVGVLSDLLESVERDGDVDPSFSTMFAKMGFLKEK